MPDQKTPHNKNGEANGFTKIDNKYFEYLITNTYLPPCTRTMLWILRNTYGWNRDTIKFGTRYKNENRGYFKNRSYVAKKLNMTHQTFIKTLNKLEEEGFIIQGTNYIKLVNYKGELCNG